ncbi:uncharacterized protein METZ01_LOCUS488827, partial [marine metagenome]
VDYSGRDNYDWITKGLDAPPEERGVLDTVIDSLTPGLDKTLQQINQQNRHFKQKPSLPDMLPNLQEQTLNQQLAERQAGLGPDT